MTAFLAPAQLTLLPSQSSLRSPIEAGIVNCLALGVGQEGLESHINADVRMLTWRGKMVRLWDSLTNDEGIPLPINTQDQMDRLRRTFYWAVQLDLDGLPHLGRNDEVLLVFMQVDIFAILPQVDRRPLVALLEAGEVSFQSKLFASKKTFEGFGETICKTLHGRGWDMLSATSFETSSKIILARECTLVLIVCFDHLKHLIIEVPRLLQALQEPAGLFFMWIQAVFKRSHRRIL